MQIDGRPVGVPSDLSTYLAAKRAGDTVVLTVRRGGGSEAQAIAFNATLGERPFELIRPEPLIPGELARPPASLLMSLEKTG